MKRFYPAIAVAAAVLSFSSCTKDETNRNEGLQSGPMEITITGEMGGFDISTRSEVESVIRMKWNTTQNDAEKDVVWVYGKDDDTTFTSLGSLKATSSEDNPYTATLAGTISGVPSDGSLYLVHCPSGTYSRPDVSTTGTITFDMSAVEQSSDVTPFIIHSSVDVSGTDLSDLTARFSFATTVVKVNLTGLEANAELTQATVSDINKCCTLSFIDGSVTVADAPASPQESDLGTFTKNLSGSATATGKATFLLAVPALSAKADRELTVTAGGKTYTEEGVFPSAHPANSYVNTICCVEEAADPNLLPGKFTVAEGKQVQFTKGNLYYSTTDSKYHIEAAQNVTYATLGQSSYTAEHVCHFFWTNLTDYQSGTASYMPYASSYSYSARSTSDKFWCGEDNKLTVEGTENLYVLTSAEWTYLISTRTNASSLYKEGVTVSNGGTDYADCLIIAPDDFTGTLEASYTLDEVNASGLVCLPAAGYWNGSTLYCGGSVGYYWSATPYGYKLDIAYLLYFNRNNINSSNCFGRDFGLSVRLVCSVTK